MDTTKTMTGWDLVQRRRSPDGKDFCCPGCGQWKDMLLLKDDGGLTCWSCLKAEKKEARHGGMANPTM